MNVTAGVEKRLKSHSQCKLQENPKTHSKFYDSNPA